MQVYAYPNTNAQSQVTTCSLPRQRICIGSGSKSAKDYQYTCTILPNHANGQSHGAPSDLLPSPNSGRLRVPIDSCIVQRSNGFIQHACECQDEGCIVLLLLKQVLGLCSKGVMRQIGAQLGFNDHHGMRPLLCRCKDICRQDG